MRKSREVTHRVRVLSREGADRARVLLRPDCVLALEGPALASLDEGDLAHVTVTHAHPARVVRAACVHRPSRSPFAPGAETRTLALEGHYARLVLRQRVINAIREYFSRQESLEVETPMLVPSPGLDVHLHAFEVRRTGGEHLRDAGTGPHTGYLATSPEYQMKRLLVGGVSACFQLVKCFRADEAGTRHEPEFTMLEWYTAWSAFDALLDETEALVREVSRLASSPRTLSNGAEKVSTEGPFERITVREAFARYAPDEGDAVELCARDEERFFRVLVEQIEPRLGFERPTFLTHYPAKLASLARLDPRDATVALRAELYALGVELCNGFEELTDAREQRARFEGDQRERRELGLPVYPIDERFLAALEEGMPPSVGNALGVDRLVALVAGRGAIADVISFARARLA